MKNHDYSPSYKHMATIALFLYVVGRLLSEAVYYFLGFQKLLLQVALQPVALQYHHLLHQVHYELTHWGKPPLLSIKELS